MTRYPLYIILFASLALNAVLVAYHATRLVAHPPSKQEIMDTRQQEFVSLLPEAAQNDLRQRLDRDRVAVQAHLENMKKTRLHIQSVLEADPVDDKALAAALAHLRFEHDRMQKIYHDDFVDSVKKMDRDQRHRLVHKMKARQSEDKGDDKGADDKPDDKGNDKPNSVSMKPVDIEADDMPHTRN